MENQSLGFFIDGLHHVQVAIPADGIEKAKDFFRDILGLREVPIPPNVSKMAVAWFEQGALRLHVGIDPDFHPSRKGHPAFSVRDFDQLLNHLAAKGIIPVTASVVNGSRRCHIQDPFGNRIELIENPSS